MAIPDRGSNQKVYIDRMLSGADDKARLLEYLKSGDSVLDVGTGKLTIPTLIWHKKLKCEVTALEASGSIYKECTEFLEENPEIQCELIHSDYTRYMNETNKKFDAIVFCSVLHELYSYVPYMGGKFRKGRPCADLVQAADRLKPGGRLIIRDAIKPACQDSVYVSFRDREMLALAKRFVKEFPAPEFFATQVDDWMFEMSYANAMEMLYTITWGEESFPFEINEQLGFFDYWDWSQMAATLSQRGLGLVHFEEYLQQGYVKHLAGKVAITDKNLQDLPLPASNSIIVFMKR